MQPDGQHRNYTTLTDVTLRPPLCGRSDAKFGVPGAVRLLSITRCQKRQQEGKQA